MKQLLWFFKGYYRLKRWAYQTPNIMLVDVLFENAKVYDVQKKIDVVIGQNFTIATDASEDSRWFADNDPVLGILVKGSSADIEAKALGKSSLLMLNPNNGIMKELEITVVEEVITKAVDIGATAGDPENKT